jgi:multisubunit Na+/H+ antiporter MnhB subunit
MAAVIGGVLLILYTVVVRISTARALRAEGTPTVTWQYLARAPNIWIGLSVVLYGFAPGAGGVLLGLVLVVCVVLLFRVSYLARKSRHEPVP